MLAPPEASPGDSCRARTINPDSLLSRAWFRMNGRAWQLMQCCVNDEGRVIWKGGWIRARRSER